MRLVVRAVGLGLLLAAAAGSSAAWSASGRAFDLQCEETRYRIDLGAKRWCEDDCATVSGLSYRGGDRAALTAMAHFSLVYDLRRKVMTYWSGGPGDEGEISRARCRVLRFSGFPGEAGKSTPAR